MFGRLTPACGPFYRRGRGGVRGNDPFGPRRDGSHKERSVNNSSLSGLSAYPPTIWDWLNQLNAASFAGHSDWRIPTVGRDSGTVQLETIVDTSVSGCGDGVPCVPPAFNTGCVAGCMATGCSCTQAESYWSATSIVGDFLPFPSAWGVFFRTGEVTGLDKASAFYVRAVRGGS